MNGSLSATANTVAARDADGYITANRFVGLATRAANINGGTAKSIPYQSDANTTAFLSPGTARQVLAINDAGNLDWISLTSLIDTGQATQIGITDREMEVVRLIAEGLSNKLIADKLDLSTHTVNTHRKNLMTKW